MTITRRAAPALLTALLLATPASAQLPPPPFSVADVTVNESAGSAVVTVTKGAGKTGYSQVAFTTADDTAKAGVDYQRVSLTLTFFSGDTVKRVTVPVIDSKQAYTSRAFTVRLGAVHNASIGHSPATVTILGPTPPIYTAWVPAPLAVGGYAWFKNQGPCCNGLVVKIVDGGLTTDADPARRQHWWAVVYYSDVSGNFPAKDPYWSTAWMTAFDDGLQGLAPAP